MIKFSLTGFKESSGEFTSWFRGFYRSLRRKTQERVDTEPDEELTRAEKALRKAIGK